MSPTKLAISLAVLLAPLAAQSPKAFSPHGARYCPGGSGNTIPFWGQSATYQQVHDHLEMLRASGGGSLSIQALSFRPFGTYTWQPRALELELKLGNTTITAAQAGMSTDFASHFSSPPTAVLPWTGIQLPLVQGTGNPNPPGLVLPFKTPFTWQNTAGNNLIWEWRHRNNTNSSPMFADSFYYDAAQAWSSSWGCTGPSEGTACTATGRATPAHASTILVGNPVWRAFTLANVQPNQPALLLFGTTRQQIKLPGMCASLLLTPALEVPGTTSSLGSWSFMVQYPRSNTSQGQPFTQLLCQYAFRDSGLPLGFGVSQMMVVNPPLPGVFDICRLWAMDYLNTTNTWSTATQATGASHRSGLVLGLH